SQFFRCNSEVGWRRNPLNSVTGSGIRGRRGLRVRRCGLLLTANCRLKERAPIMSRPSRPLTFVPKHKFAPRRRSEFRTQTSALPTARCLLTNGFRRVLSLVSLSLWERAGVRAYRRTDSKFDFSLRRSLSEKRSRVRDIRALSPHPDPLP